jgi:hypothetical protein
LKYYPGIFLERLREATKTSVRIAGVPGVLTETGTEHLLKPDLECYYNNDVLGIMDR